MSREIDLEDTSVEQDDKGSDTRSAIDRRAIVDDLHALGLSDGDVVLVHSSLSGLGWVQGGAGTVIDALVEAVGPGGTVLFPTLTGTEQDGAEHPPVIRAGDHAVLDRHDPGDGAPAPGGGPQHAPDALGERDRGTSGRVHDWPRGIQDTVRCT